MFVYVTGSGKRFLTNFAYNDVDFYNDYPASVQSFLPREL